MTLSKKGMQELEKLMGEMSNEQLSALKTDIDGQLLPKMTYQELLAARDKLSNTIMGVQEAERQKFMDDARAKYEALQEQAKQLGLDLGTAIGIAPQPRRSKPATNGTSSERASAPVKYRNPRNQTETWSGRGRRAGWIVRELASRGLSENSEIPQEFHVS